MTTELEVLKVSEVAKMLRVTEPVIIDMIRDHKIQAFRAGEKSWRIIGSSVSDYINSFTVTSTR